MPAGWQQAESDRGTREFWFRGQIYSFDALHEARAGE
jgi:hypothetical protein